MEDVLTVSNVRKQFGAFEALRGIDFSVRRGECFSLLGPNGAGKSTTLKLALGLLRPNSGNITLLGHPIPHKARIARERVGVVPQADALDPDFTVSENIQIFASYFRLSKKTISERLPQLLEFAGLSSKGDVRIQDLSGGMRRRLTLARALVNAPEVLFLDEPTTGLDPQARHVIWARLRQLLTRGTTIILTTHFLEEAERLSSRLAIVDKGQVVVSDTPQALIAREIEPYVLEASGVDPSLEARLARLPVRIEHVGETVFVYCRSFEGISDVTPFLEGLRFLQRPANLEDVFLKLTGRDLRD